MNYLDFTWDGSPIICIWDSDYNRHATTAILMWYDGLTERFGEGYEFTTWIISGYTDFTILEKCNINIVYVEMEYASAEELDGVTGTMLHRDISSNFYLYIYEARPAHPNLESFDNSMIRTTLHEIGHAFGLGHVTPDSAGEAMKPWPDTLMWPYQDTSFSIEIDENTLLAFKCLYHTNSWVGNHPDNCKEFRMDINTN